MDLTQVVASFSLALVPSSDAPSSWEERTPTWSSPIAIWNGPSTPLSRVYSCTPVRSALQALVLIVEESIADKSSLGIVERAKRIQMGNGMDPASETGPLVSAAHLAKVEAYVKLGMQEGAKLLVGGSRPDPKEHPELAKGYFFCPTVLDHCNRDMRIVQEETFGPSSPSNASQMGTKNAPSSSLNDTKYGLAGGVQSSNVERARRVAKRLRHGTVWVNTYGSYTPAAEWGGFGMSGNGRELGSKGWTSISRRDMSGLRRTLQSRDGLRVRGRR